jgi:pimeloyl-ACP methyl ester carboxylesterase
MSDSVQPLQAALVMPRLLCMAFLLLNWWALSVRDLSGQNSQEVHAVRNIVLVHGAWADGSGWKGVFDILVKDGYNVSIVQEPETSFEEDVAATKRVLALQDGPCILVAYSYGGSVITEAGTDPSVAGLVYVAAHMPDAGESEAGDGKRFPSDLSKSNAIKKTADVSITLTPRSFVNTSQPTYPPSKPLSRRVRRCSSPMPISAESSPHLRGEANQAGCW